MSKVENLLSQKVRDWILKDIKNKILNVGDRLPPEAELRKRFACSNHPVRQAISGLVAEGILEKHHGKGTFIRSVVKRLVKTGKIAVLYKPSDEWVFVNSYYNAILAGLAMQASVADRSLVFRSFFKGETGDPNQLILQMASEADGIIMLVPSRELMSTVTRTLQSLRKPCVVVEYEEVLPGIDTICSNSAVMITRMVTYLAGLGHTRFACVNPSKERNHPNFVNRIRGFKEALTSHNLSVEERFIIAPEFRYTSDTFSFTKNNYLPVTYGEPDPATVRAFAEVLQDPHPPTAFICLSDDIAFRVMATMRSLGKNIPEDVTVVGYDNLRECETVRPALTTVHTPLIQMGVRAVKRIVEKEKELKDGLPEHLHTVLEGYVVERESHGPLKA